MLRHRLQMFVLLLVLPITVFTAEPHPVRIYHRTAPGVLEIVELSAEDRDALLAAPQTALNHPGPTELGEAIRIGTIENIKVDRSTEKFTGEIAAEIGSDTITTYQGWIRYTPVVLSDSREYRPVILCVSQDEKITWIHCQDESWTKVQTSTMKNPVRLDRRLPDTVVEQALAYVDRLGLISKRDNSTITANSIHRIVGKGPEGHEGDDIVRLFSRTQVAGYWDAIELRDTLDSSGASVFELEDFKSGQ